MHHKDPCIPEVIPCFQIAFGRLLIGLLAELEDRMDAAADLGPESLPPGDCPPDKPVPTPWGCQPWPTMPAHIPGGTPPFVPGQPPVTIPGTTIPGTTPPPPGGRPEPPPGEAGAGVPEWVLPAAIGTVAVVGVALLVMRKK